MSAEETTQGTDPRRLVLRFVDGERTYEPIPEGHVLCPLCRGLCRLHPWTKDHFRSVTCWRCEGAGYVADVPQEARITSHS
jgi:hypothetical protein